MDADKQTERQKEPFAGSSTETLGKEIKPPLPFPQYLIIRPVRELPNLGSVHIALNV